MKKLFTASIVLIGLIATIHADDGYVFRNGYYYYGNEAQAYYRSLITVPGYYSYGAYYPGYSYYKYYPYTPSNPVAPAPALDWRSRTLDIAKIQVQYNAKREAEILEQKNYLEAIKALGLQGIGHSQGYGTIPPYVVDGHYQSTYLSGYGANASTVYGYNAYANANSNDFLAQLFQMANQQTINSQALTDKAQTGFQTLINQEGANRAKVAEIMAKSQMVVAMLKSLEGPPSALTQGYSFKISQDKGLQVDSGGVAADVKAKLAEQFKALVTAKCAECHSPTNKKGGFDVFTYTALSPDAKQIVWDRLTTQDPAKLMPRDKKGGTGTRLTPEELRLFATN